MGFHHREAAGRRGDAQVRAERDLEATAQADAMRGHDDGRGYTPPEVANVLCETATQSVAGGGVSVVSYHGAAVVEREA